MFQEAPGFEQRLVDLQAQIDRLTIALQLWRDGQERLTQPDERLSRFADDVADVLQEWSAIGERHARAVDALEHQVAAFATTEARLHEESAQRFLTLQRMVQQEWAALRSVQYEPSGAGREQAAALTHACVVAASTRVLPEEDSATAGSAEADLQQYFSQVVSEPASMEPVTDVVAEATPEAAPVEAPVPPAVADGVPADEPPHERSEVRDADMPVTLLTEPVVAPPAPPEASVVEPVPIRPSGFNAVPGIPHEYLSSDEADALRGELMRRMAEMRVMFRESIEQAADQQDMRDRATRRLLYVVICAIVVLAAVGAWWTISLQRQLSSSVSRLAEVESTSARAQATTAQALAESRAESARLADAAKQAEANTAAMSAVLASPDLVRYALSGVDGSRIAAQLLWSRGRGLVLSATDLTPLPEGQVYQVWLLTESDAVSAGLLQVTADGRGSLISARPPVVPRPAVGVSITIEPSAGSTSPSGRIVALNRIVRPATP